MKETIIKVGINSIHALPSAYGEAIKRFVEGYGDDEGHGDVWKGNIELPHIEIQETYDRRERICVFKITVQD